MEFVLSGLLGGSTRQALELCIEEESAIPGPFRLAVGEKPYQIPVNGKLSWSLSRMKFYNGAVVYFEPEKEHVLSMTRQSSIEKKLIDLDIIIVPDPTDHDKKLVMIAKEGHHKKDTKKEDLTDDTAQWYDLEQQQQRLLSVLHNLEDRTKFLETHSTTDEAERLVINELLKWDDLARLQGKILDKLYLLDERLEKERLETTAETDEAKVLPKSSRHASRVPTLLRSQSSETKNEWAEIQNLQEGVIKKVKDLEVRFEKERLAGLSPEELAAEEKKTEAPKDILDTRKSILDTRKSKLDPRSSKIDTTKSEDEKEIKETKQERKFQDILDSRQSILDPRIPTLDTSRTQLDTSGGLGKELLTERKTTHEVPETKQDTTTPPDEKEQLPSFATSESKMEQVHVISDYFELKGELEADTVQDIGNIVWFEHINLNVPDKHLSDLFYGDLCGFTRDPYKMGSYDTTHWNLGRQQIHLPLEEEGPAQNSRGVLGLALRPDLFESFKDRFTKGQETLKKAFHETEVSFKEEKWENFPFKSTFAQYQGKASVYYEITCPWGNRFRVHPASPTLNASLGLTYLQLRCLHGTAKHIARFYQSLIGATARLKEENDVEIALISLGPQQNLIFMEIPKNEPQQLDQYDGHHICIYIANLSQTFKRLQSRKLIYVNKRFEDRAKTMEEALHYRGFRFKDIVMVEGRGRLFQLEHEVRSVVHPSYLKPLVNRVDNPLLPY